MKIITNFKDYYDHIAFKYGGGDPKIVYLRPFHLKIDSEALNDYNEFEFLTKLGSLYLRHYDWSKTYNTDIRVIVVGDIVFTQIREVIHPPYSNQYEDVKYLNWRMITEKDLLNKDKDYSRWWLRRFGRSEDLKLSDFINFTDPKLVKVCKMVGTPVFYINVFKRGVKVDIECPNLGNDGIASYISPEDMYQHLSYFVGNKMKDSPDTMPPIKVEDKHKIVGHGFDLKTSFRKPKQDKRSRSSVGRASA